mgnify:FL=1
MIKNIETEELKMKCLDLISATLIQLGQTKAAEDKAILVKYLSDDLQRDFYKMDFIDIEEAFRNGIRSGDFHLAVPNYYKWIKIQKEILNDDLFAKQLPSYRPVEQVSYRSRKGTGIKNINKLIK